eukprot:SAG22_NODE_213_length_15041_cov_3.683732_15_plen_152_part_00
MGEESFGSPEHMNDEQLGGRLEYLRKEKAKLKVRPCPASVHHTQDASWHLCCLVLVLPPLTRRPPSVCGALHAQEELVYRKAEPDDERHTMKDGAKWEHVEEDRVKKDIKERKEKEEKKKKKAQKKAEKESTAAEPAAAEEEEEKPKAEPA